MKRELLDLFALPYLSGLTCQVIKFLNYWIIKREFNFHRLFELGGLPSAHAAASISLTTLIGIYEGLDSPLFIVAIFISMFIMGEATVVRRVTGRHAEVINKFLDVIPDEKIASKKLQIPIGHTPFEVIIGSIFGFLFALAFCRG
ncbi:MAG: divergent PAP2 family protein [candidate division WOR-3 bacterium]|nr:divergent PAP2 family protein [candidate division WOR-3 bacterium]